MSPPLGEGSEVAGKYRVVRHLGSGGMGHVYAARDLVRGETIALKVLPGDKRRDVRARSRLVLEGRAAAGVQHPGIVRVYDVGEAGEITYVAMELLEGEDLHERMHRRGALPIDEVLALGRALLEAMAAMHDADIIHRDLKPRNLFLARDAVGRETLKVLDFGIAKSLAPSDHALTDSGQVFGTLHYMAPEQLRGVKHADVRSEIWAAGAILYEALTGRPPFEADNGPELVLKIAIEMPDPVRLHRPDVPDGLRRAIARAMQRDPAARFTSAREMLAAIDASDAEATTLLDADTRPIAAHELAALGELVGTPQVGTHERTRIALGAPARGRSLPWVLLAGLCALVVFGVTRGFEAMFDRARASERALQVQPSTGLGGVANASTTRSDASSAMVHAAEAARAHAAIMRAAELAGMAAATPDAGGAADCDVTPEARSPSLHARLATPSRGTASEPRSRGAQARSHAPHAATASRPAHAHGAAASIAASPRELGASSGARRPAPAQNVDVRPAKPSPVPSSAGALKRAEF